LLLENNFATGDGFWEDCNGQDDIKHQESEVLDADSRRKTLIRKEKRFFSSDQRQSV